VLNDETLDMLVNPTPPPEWVLWFRPGRGQPWESVTVARCWAEALDNIGIGGRQGGDWMALQKPQHPNDKPPPRG
jgi:hypothetical protein